MKGEMTLEYVEKYLEVNNVHPMDRMYFLWLISEVKRLRGAIESILSQKDLISYAIESELREALEEEV